MTQKVLLVVLDGFGHNSSQNGNAVAHAGMPFYNSLLGKYPHTLLHASSEHVGLPPNTMGNSEVGHINIGAGRVVYQPCLKINRAIADKSFFGNKTLANLFAGARKRSKSVHLFGLLSDASVHSHVSHLLALIKMARSFKVRAYLHLFTDGRDMPPDSSLKLLRKVLSSSRGLVSVATVSGRYYGMDRDRRWSRTKKAYDAIVSAKGLHASSPIAAVRGAYSRKESDEFITPTVISGYPGLNDGDFVFSFNFRADRARQMCMAFLKKSASRFRTSPKKAVLATMTVYGKSIRCPAAFHEAKLRNMLAEVLSKKRLRQLHIAETEKYAHVTYFFNGGREAPFKLEDRILIPSLKISTYDRNPSMSAPKITDAAVNGIMKGSYSFILVNYANPDMVGHTGNFKATLMALKTVDRCLSRLVAVALREKYVVAITADHGNCEQMTKGLTTSHTKNRVPFILIAGQRFKLRQGSLSDVAPTLLKLLNLPKPKEMTGKPLFSK